MSTYEPPKTPAYVILVAIDKTEAAQRVLDAAIALARRTPSSELHVVHAFDPRSTSDEGLAVVHAGKGAYSVRSEYLDAHARAAQIASGAPVVGHLRECDAVRAILQTSSSIDADVIVVGTHGRRGLERWRMGSVAEAVVRDATCPVWIVRDKEHARPRAPEIEAPCTDCVATQRATHGASLWCARHAQHHPRAHLHYENPPGFGAGSSLLST